MTSSPANEDPPQKGRRKKPTPVAFGMPEPEREAALAARLGITFQDPYLLRMALTHRSVLHDWAMVKELNAHRESNERLEFLGDALLGAIIADYLYHYDPEANEGTLTRWRVAIVRAETLVDWARQLGLADALYLGTGEQVSQGVRDRMLAGAFEALLGAIYLDQGREAAIAFVHGFIQREVEEILGREEMTNPKGRLQELLQEEEGVAPEYETLAVEGPDHARYFTVEVTLHGERLAVGEGRSKREAQQAAARAALIERREHAAAALDGDMAADARDPAEG
jgi:ribonuclease-3